VDRELMSKTSFWANGGGAMRVLLIEDDPMVGQSLRRALHEQGILVDWARDGVEGAQELRGKRHAAVLLDIGLPGRSGVDLLRSARDAEIDTPVLMISARADVEQRVTSLNLGADDYIVKPFELREVVARLHAVIRRHDRKPRSVLSAGEIAIDLASHVVHYRDRTARLPAREFSLLKVLLEQAGRIVSRTEIERAIYIDSEAVESNAIAVLIHAIRQKFDREIIRNVRGAGWLVVRDPS
jgi:two-component system OmpR family response regulator